MRQFLVQPQALIVKRNGFGGAIIRAQNSRIAATITPTEITPVEHRNVFYTQFAEIIGGSQAVDAGPDNHDIVAVFQLVPTPHPLGAKELQHDSSLCV